MQASGGVLGLGARVGDHSGDPYAGIAGPADRQRMLRAVRSRDASLEGRRILVVEDDVRNVFALSSV